MKKNVLIFVQISTHFVEMIRVAELLQSQPSYRPVVLFMAMYQGVERHIERCAAAGIAYLVEPELGRYLPAPAPPARGKWAPAATALRFAVSRLKGGSSKLAAVLDERMPRARRPLVQGWSLCISGLKASAVVLLRLLFRPFPGPRLQRLFDVLPRALARALAGFGRALAGIVGLFIRLLRPSLRAGAVASFGLAYRFAPRLMPPECRVQHYLLRALPGLLEQEHIDVLVLPEDNFYYFTNFFVKAVQARGGVALIVPFTIVNVLEWAEAFFDQTSHDTRTPVNRLTAELFPEWVLQHRGRNLVMPVHHVLCNEYFEVSPPIPWLINSGHTDKIAAESRFMENYYRSAGIPVERIRFTGALYDDALFRARQELVPRRAELYCRLGCPPGRPLVLCALPPDQLKGQGRPQCAFSEYSELLRLFVEPLSRLVDSHNVVLSPHPRIDDSDLERIEAPGLFICRDNIADIVPLCDLYVASCSATIRLAANCGIPVVNYDVYRYDYDDYRNVPGVKTLSDQDDYAEALVRLCALGGDYAALRSAQQAFADAETCIDGQAGARIVGLIDELCAGMGERFRGGEPVGQSPVCGGSIESDREPWRAPGENSGLGSSGPSIEVLIHPTRLAGAVIIEPRTFGDESGFFMESWNRPRYAEAGLDVDFVQDNLSFSRRGVLRGPHFQMPNAQGKLMQVLQGEVYGVAVDIRVGSPTFGQWEAVVLSAENRRQLYVPPGFAHGFCVTSETALFAYKCTDIYNPGAEASILWNDPDLAIPWPVAEPQLSGNDAAGVRLRDMPAERLPCFEG